MFTEIVLFNDKSAPDCLSRARLFEPHRAGKNSLWQFDLGYRV